MPGRVMIVEDSATNRFLLRSKLTQAYYDVIIAEDGESALEMVSKEEPDLILLDIMMPGIDGFEVCRRLKLDPNTMHIPVIIQTALDNQQDRVRGLEAGADDFLTKPCDDATLMGRVESLTRMKVMADELTLRGQTSLNIAQDLLQETSRATEFPESTVLVVSDETETADALRECLRRDVRCKVQMATGAASALSNLDAFGADAVIIDDTLSDGDAMRLGATIRARPESRQAAVMLILGEGTRELAARALSLGINDHIASPVDMVELIARTRSQLRRKHYSDLLRETMRTIMVDANSDPLTGCYNRRYALPHLDALIVSCLKREAELAVLVLDLDRFKSVNDTYGHAAGDTVLVEFARRLTANVRGMDLVARMGGEEFMVVMPDAQPEMVAEIAERVRDAVASASFLIDTPVPQHELSVTVSIGFALLRDHETAQQLIERADRALYQSKHAGRNRVTRARAA